MSLSLRDPGQILQSAYDQASGSLRVTPVDSTSGATVISSTQTAAASINGSGGAITQLVASTSGNISKLVPNEQTGVPINVYTGASGFEVLLCIIAPGQDNVVEAQIPAGTRISIRANQSSAPQNGSFFLTCTG